MFGYQPLVENFAFDIPNSDGLSTWWDCFSNDIGLKYNATAEEDLTYRKQRLALPPIEGGYAIYRVPNYPGMLSEACVTCTAPYVALGVKHPIVTNDVYYSMPAGDYLIMVTSGARCR